MYNNTTWTSGLYDELLYKYPTNKSEIVSKHIIKIPKVASLDESIRTSMEQNRPDYFKGLPQRHLWLLVRHGLGEFCAVGTTDELIHVYKTPIINTVSNPTTGALPGQSTRLADPAKSSRIPSLHTTQHRALQCHH
jgi:hypothetical protein